MPGFGVAGFSSRGKQTSSAPHLFYSAKPISCILLLCTLNTSLALSFVRGGTTLHSSQDSAKLLLLFPDFASAASPSKRSAPAFQSLDRFEQLPGDREGGIPFVWLDQDCLEHNALRMLSLLNTDQIDCTRILRAYQDGPTGATPPHLEGRQHAFLHSQRQDSSGD